MYNQSREQFRNSGYSYSPETGGSTPPQQRQTHYQTQNYQPDLYSEQKFIPIHSQIGLKTQSKKDQQIHYSKQSGRLAYSLTKKAINKQPQPQQSQQGFLRKQHGTSTVEDEYIGNLQQQIYFLELETKLLKEKERERTTGLFEGQDGSLLSDNIIQLKNKYTSMRSNLELQIEAINRENHEYKTLISTQERKLSSLQNQIEELKGYGKNYKSQNDQELEKLRRTLTKTNKEREDVQMKLKDLTNERQSFKTQVGELKIQNDKLKSTINQIEEQYQSLENQLRQEINDKQNEIISLQNANITLDGQIQNNEQTQYLENMLKERIQQINNLELEVQSNLNKLKTLEYSNQILQQNLLEQTNEFQNLKREKEELKIQLQFQQAQQESTVNQRIKEEQTKEMLIAKSQIQDLKKESSFYSDSFRNKVKEFQTMVDEKNIQYFELQEIKNQYEQLLEKFNFLEEEHEKHQIDYTEFQHQFHNQQKEMEKIQKENEIVQKKNQELSTDNLELICKVEEYSKQTEVARLLSQLDPEELRLLAKQNSQVNNTINSLINKFDTIGEPSVQTIVKKEELYKSQESTSLVSQKQTIEQLKNKYMEQQDKQSTLFTKDFE